MLDKLRERLNNLIEDTTDSDTLNKYKLIKTIIAYDYCFLEMDASTAVSLIKDLQYDDKKAREIYLSLLEEEYGWNIQAS